MKKIKWYFDGTTNVSYNCVDRHLQTKGNKIAIIWEGDDPKNSKNILGNFEINISLKKGNADFMHRLIDVLYRNASLISKSLQDTLKSSSQTLKHLIPQIKSPEF